MERSPEKELLEFEKELLEERLGNKNMLHQYLFVIMCFLIFFLVGVLVYIITSTNSFL